MSLDRLKKLNEDNVRKKQEMMKERAQEHLNSLLETPQFALYAKLPDSRACIDSIVASTIEVNVNPIAQYIDTLRSMGFRQGHIRRITHQFYTAYVDPGPAADNLSYEQMLDPVANYIYAHQELYNSINLDLYKD